MANSIKLFCWILGESESPFEVKIAKDNTVAGLKGAIKEENPNTLIKVDAHQLRLWKVSIPDGDQLEASIRQTVLGSPLRSMTLISAVFPSTLPMDVIHVLIKLPEVEKALSGESRSISEPELELACLVHGEDADEIFLVRIKASAKVDDLKGAIRLKREPTLDGIDIVKLKLFKTSIPIDDNFCQAVGDANLTPLGPVELLSQVFPIQLPQAHVHIIIKGQRFCFCLKHFLMLELLLRDICPDGPFPHRNNPRRLDTTKVPAGKLQLTPGVEEPVFDTIQALRIRTCAKVPKKAPSTLGKPSIFRDYQDKLGLFQFERPSLTAAHDIPLTLLHSIFGKFVDDCEKHVPTRKDNLLAHGLRDTMSKIFNDEGERVQEFIEVLRHHGIEARGSDMYCEGSTYRTDGDIQENGFRFAIIEFKNEISAGGSDPLLEGIWYYQRSVSRGGEMRMQVANYPNSSLPCLLLYAFGAHIGFAGAAYGKSPHIQVLSSPLPLFYHHNDVRLQLTVARHIGAFKNAIESLRKYYQNLSKPSSMGLNEPAICYPHPYPTQFESLHDGPKSVLHFTYKEKFTDKLVFEATLADGDRICVKFVQRYSREVHEECIKLGCAPTLRGFEHLDGGWIMVVMDFLDGYHYHPFDDSHISTELYASMHGVLEKLHQANLVHGDIRDVNTMVKNDDPSKFMLLDFDWAGRNDDARYPPNVNRSPELKRPKEAMDGELIRAEHDVAMLNVMFHK